MAELNRVLLVLPSFKSDTGSSWPSPSIGYPAQALEDSGIEYDMLDMMLGYSFRALIKKARAFRPDLIGPTLFTLGHKSRLNKEILSVMRRIERNYIKRVLRRKVGFLGVPLAYLACTRFVQRLYFSNNCFRKAAELFKYSTVGTKG